MNPYWGLGFWKTLTLLLHRTGLLLLGKLPLSALNIDDLQWLTLSLVGVSASFLGTILTLQKRTMMANSLSHTILLGLVSTFILFDFHSLNDLTLYGLLFAALISGVLTTLLAEMLHKIFRLQEDASIGLTFTFLFALGILLITLYTRSLDLGVEAIVGNADALQQKDLMQSLFVFLFVVALFFFSSVKLKILSFDPAFAKNVGLHVSIWHYLMMILTSAVAVVSFKAVGVILYLAFLVVIPAIARNFADQFEKLLIFSAGIAITTSLLSVALSRYFLSKHYIAFSTSGLMITILGILLVSIHAIKEINRRNQFVEDRHA